MAIKFKKWNQKFWSSQKSFIQEHMYVALSKVTNFESMYLIGSYQRSIIMVNLSVKNEYVWLRGENKMTPLPKHYLI